jgi:SAM-dependent methyltransferase
MDRKYWEKIAPEYNEEIFDVLKQDKKGLIRKAILRYAGKEKTVLDAGCAIGKWLPVLSPLFKKVIAADISSKNLAIAEKNHPQLFNVLYKRMDMSSPGAQLIKADMVLCVNAILTDSLKKRHVFFKNLGKSIKKGGHLVLVVPSLDSYLFTRIIQHRWKIDRSLLSEKLSPGEGLKKYRNVLQGNLDIDGVPTKHYLKEELVLLLDEVGIEAGEFNKIEYGWETEFVKPPAWLIDPKPWDWMVVGVKK